MESTIIVGLLGVSSYSISAKNWSQLSVSGSTSLHGCSFSPNQTNKGWLVGYYFNAAFDFIPFE